MKRTYVKLLTVAGLTGCFLFTFLSFSTRNYRPLYIQGGGQDDYD